tara:strand:- start:3336 stop:3863 length:528 start_codon:yes stop_codon:yes gene_type:complete
MVLIIGIDYELIGYIALKDLGLDKCKNCNATDTFEVKSMMQISKILAWQVGAKFGGKSVWNFNVMCPICEKGYSFAKEKGRDEVQKLMLKNSSLGINAWTHFWLSHTLFEQHENEKERLKQIKLFRKEAKTRLDDLARLGMHDLVKKIVSSKNTHSNWFKERMETTKGGFDIKLN